MTRQRDALSEALRELSATSPGASADLHARLGEAFVRHHARRRLRQRAGVVVGLAASIALGVYWLRPQPPITQIKANEPVPHLAEVPSPEPEAVPPQSPKVTARPVAHAGGKPRVHVEAEPKTRQRGVESTPVPVETADFVALPSFDPAVPVGESRMVRMNLSGSALQLIGYPVEGQLLDRHILTDVLVGQDGMPYAVRLVQSRNGY